MIEVPGLPVIVTDNGFNAKLRIAIIGVRIAFTHHIRHNDIVIRQDNHAWMMVAPAIKSGYFGHVLPLSFEMETPKPS